MGGQEHTQQRQATRSKIQEEAAGQKSKRLVGRLEANGTGQVALWPFWQREENALVYLAQAGDWGNRRIVSEVH